MVRVRPLVASQLAPVVVVGVVKASNSPVTVTLISFVELIGLPSFVPLAATLIQAVPGRRPVMVAFEPSALLLVSTLITSLAIAVCPALSMVVQVYFKSVTLPPDVWAAVSSVL